MRVPLIVAHRIDAPASAVQWRAGPAIKLQLDAGQQDQVKKILDEHRAHLDQVHREAREKFDKEQEELQNAVRGVLHPDQQEKFQRFLERRR